MLIIKDFTSILYLQLKNSLASFRTINDSQSVSTSEQVKGLLWCPMLLDKPLWKHWLPVPDQKR
jgi:hypothetical protein